MMSQPFQLVPMRNSPHSRKYQRLGPLVAAFLFAFLYFNFFFGMKIYNTRAFVDAFKISKYKLPQKALRSFSVEVLQDPMIMTAEVRNDLLKFTSVDSISLHNGADINLTDSSFSNFPISRHNEPIVIAIPTIPRMSANYVDEVISTILRETVRGDGTILDSSCLDDSLNQNDEIEIPFGDIASNWTTPLRVLLVNGYRPQHPVGNSFAANQPHFEFDKVVQKFCNIVKDQRGIRVLRSLNIDSDKYIRSGSGVGCFERRLKSTRVIFHPNLLITFIENKDAPRPYDFSDLPKVSENVFRYSSDLLDVLRFAHELFGQRAIKYGQSYIESEHLEGRIDGMLGVPSLYEGTGPGTIPHTIDFDMIRRDPDVGPIDAGTSLENNSSKIGPDDESKESVNERPVLDRVRRSVESVLGGLKDIRTFRRLQASYYMLLEDDSRICPSALGMIVEALGKIQKQQADPFTMRTASGWNGALFSAHDLPAFSQFLENRMRLKRPGQIFAAFQSRTHTEAQVAANGRMPVTYLYNLVDHWGTVSSINGPLTTESAHCYSRTLDHLDMGSSFSDLCLHDVLSPCLPSKIADRLFGTSVSTSFDIFSLFQDYRQSKMMIH